MENPNEGRQKRDHRGFVLRRWVLLTLLICLGPAVANGMQPEATAQSRFENPPLLYEGPDPTASYFLSPSTAGGTNDPWTTTRSAVSPANALVAPLTGPDEGWKF